MTNGVTRVLGWLRGLATLALMIALVGGALWLLGTMFGPEEPGGPPLDNDTSGYEQQQNDEYMHGRDELLEWQLQEQQRQRQQDLDQSYTDGYNEGFEDGELDDYAPDGP
jgi:hypothetical protein